MTSVIKVDTIQNSSGTSALSIDGSGNITANQYIKQNAIPAFRVYSTAGSFQQGHVEFNNVAFDVTSSYSTSGHYFEAPVDGIYRFDLVTFACASDGNTATGTSASQFQVSTNSGSSWTDVIHMYGNTPSSSYPQRSGTALLNLSAGDYVRISFGGLYAYSDSSGLYLHFSGHLVA